jgi:hypothetical protein
MEGGGEGPYLVTYLSRHYGPVYVMQGKMPTFPDTYAGNDGRGVATMPSAQTQYWSLVSCESVPSGQVVDGLTDFQIPLDQNRNYTIVVSRPEDRPTNATLENGVAWIKWSTRGDGVNDPRNRADFGMLILRIMGNSPDWAERPDNIKIPGSGEAVMGSYFPKGHYTTKEQFEAKKDENQQQIGEASPRRDSRVHPDGIGRLESKPGGNGNRYSRYIQCEQSCRRIDVCLCSRQEAGGREVDRGSIRRSRDDDRAGQVCDAQIADAARLTGLPVLRACFQLRCEWQ